MANLYLNFRSDSLSRSVYPIVFLPDFNNWNDVQPPYPTLYFLPGYSGGALETSMFTNFAFFAMKYGVAIVLVDGENSFYVDDEQRSGKFSQYVGEEIVNVTRNLLPLSHRKEETFIGGISMGGYGALINALRYQETFSKVAMLSPALGLHPSAGIRPDVHSLIVNSELLSLLGNEEAYCGTYKDYEWASREAFLNGNEMPEIFMACGRQDVLVLNACRAYVRNMEAMGHAILYRETAGGHDHTFWKQAMTPLCEFLMQKGGK